MTRSLVLLVTLVLAACSTQAAPTPTPTTAPSLEWVAAEVPETDSGSSVTAVIPGGDGLVAIGFDGWFGTLVWTSADGGRSWRDVTPDGFDEVGIASVVPWRDGFVGVGRGSTHDPEVQEAAVYLSTDGIEWRRVPHGPQLLGQMIDVVATDDGLVAVGGIPGADAAGAWHSADGETWERIGPDIEHAFLWAVTEGGPGLVGVGWRRNPEPQAAVWTSADGGATWDLAPDPADPAGTEMTDVATLADGTLVAIGSAFDGSGGRAWTSADGITWASAPFEDGWARNLTPLADGALLAAGGAGETARAWSTTDGATWATHGEPIADAYLHDAAVTDAGPLLLGATQTGTLETGVEAHAAIWLADPG